MNAFSLEDKVAIVSGASRGIGEAIARTFALEGAKLVLASRKADSLALVAESIHAAGGEATPIATHMGDTAAVAALVRQASEIYGGVDIVVNNAATNPHFGPLLTSEESMWDKTLDVNLRGYFRLIREAVPLMIGRGGGKIINLASTAGLVPSLGMGLYGITKAAVIMLTKTLAVELAPHNIQVNAIAPGLVKTQFSRALWENEAIYAQLIRHTPSRRMGTVDEIAVVALYLASQASNFTTGQTIVVDGGQTLALGGPGAFDDGGAS
jgi:NAD(P)-dependent dehydrogenase (short-subunit alcohol dehydrogenase family)